MTLEILLKWSLWGEYFSFLKMCLFWRGSNQKVSWQFICIKNLLSFRSPGGIYLFKSNNRNTRIMCKISSNLTIKTPEWQVDVFVLVFLSHFFNVSMVDYEQQLSSKKDKTRVSSIVLQNVTAYRIDCRAMFVKITSMVNLDISQENACCGVLFY